MPLFGQFGGTILIVFKYFKFVFLLLYDPSALLHSRDKCIIKFNNLTIVYIVICSIQFNYVCVAMFLH